MSRRSRGLDVGPLVRALATGRSNLGDLLADVTDAAEANPDSIAVLETSSLDDALRSWSLLETFGTATDPFCVFLHRWCQAKQDRCRLFVIRHMPLLVWSYLHFSSMGVAKPGLEACLLTFYNYHAVQISKEPFKMPILTKPSIYHRPDRLGAGLRLTETVLRQHDGRPAPAATAQAAPALVAAINASNRFLLSAAGLEQVSAHMSALPDSARLSFLHTCCWLSSAGYPFCAFRAPPAPSTLFPQDAATGKQTSGRAKDAQKKRRARSRSYSGSRSGKGERRNGKRDKECDESASASLVTASGERESDASSASETYLSDLGSERGRSESQQPKDKKNARAVAAVPAAAPRPAVPPIAVPVEGIEGRGAADVPAPLNPGAGSRRIGLDNAIVRALVPGLTWCLFNAPLGSPVDVAARETLRLLHLRAQHDLNAEVLLQTTSLTRALSSERPGATLALLSIPASAALPPSHTPRRRRRPLSPTPQLRNTSEGSSDHEAGPPRDEGRRTARDERPHGGRDRGPSGGSGEREHKHGSKERAEERGAVGRKGGDSNDEDNNRRSPRRERQGERRRGGRSSRSSDSGR